MGLKTNRLVKAEKAYIDKHYETTDAVTIAAILNRHPDKVVNYLKETGRKAIEPGIKKKGPDEELTPLEKLHSSIIWRHLAEEFSPSEIMLFEERYNALTMQFKDDIMASEEVQLFKAIKIEILMHRNLVQQKRSQEEIEYLEAEKKALLKRKSSGDEEAADALLQNDISLQQAYAAKQSRTNEYDKLDSAHAAAMKGLKATREQRIARATDNKRSLLDIIRMLQEKDNAEREDRRIDLMRKQADKELARLGSIHMYADGFPDRPILNAETVQYEE